MEQKGYPSMQASEFHSQHQPQNNPPPYDMHNQHQAQPQMAPGFIYSQTTTPQMHTIMEQPTILVAPNVGPDPSMVTCPSCRSTIVTRMEYEPSTRTHIFAGVLCLVGCWLCCCIPYCIDSCKNGNHYCPACNSYIGTYKS